MSETNQAGCYEVKFYINGELCPVAVDDCFPCRDGQPAFSKSNGNELWVLILEKAWAKACGNYEKTVIGYASEALRALTGAPVRFLDHEFEEDIWQIILEADKLKHVVCCSAGKPNLSSADFQSVGLVSDHAYSVVSVHEVQGEKLLKLHNPWGHQEWLGDWSDHSDKWTPQLK